MDKLILRVKQPKRPQSSLVRISDDAMALLQEVQMQSGLSACEIASQMIRFAAERVEIVVY